MPEKLSFKKNDTKYRNFIPSWRSTSSTLHVFLRLMSTAAKFTTITFHNVLLLLHCLSRFVSCKTCTNHKSRGKMRKHRCNSIFVLLQCRSSSRATLWRCRKLTHGRKFSSDRIRRFLFFVYPHTTSGYLKVANWRIGVYIAVIIYNHLILIYLVQNQGLVHFIYH